MTFSDDLNRFSATLETRSRDVFVGVVEKAHESIQTGSAITGAPGQPVDTGALRASWQVQYPAADEALISTNLEYAQPIEDGIGKHGPLQLRSAVGGFHSVKTTVAGFQRIVDQVTREVQGQ
ncbi:MAG TPA: hypothetical protein VNK51_05550 [Bradyrhizobium sp.]|nr:hypothetical protein [Bradyrhizobium sp.]